MMLRVRRYRAFLLVAVVVTFSLYHLTRIRKWDAQSIGVPSIKNLGNHFVTTSTITSLPTTSITQPLDLAVPVAPSSRSFHDQPPHTPTSTLSSTLLDVPLASTTSSSKQAQKTAPAKDGSAANGLERLPDDEDVSDELESYGQGRLEVDHHSSPPAKPHWEAQKDHFPVPSNSIIQLPTGRPKQIPAIQHVLATETEETVQSNEQKRGAVKEAFEHAWNGYKSYAIPHDELAPVSKDFKDPFNGWGATLVDTLDTLWIMDLKEEFEEAVSKVKAIDFKTSTRKDIPLFETVIRYLGGLIAAYDVSSGRYPVLLDKAVELAEILMGAFDTPNRMPVTYYYWAPSYVSLPRRASSKVVLAELGSLSLEFTRLAQITKDNRYYDAIARITNQLEAWQNSTKLPGLWPVSVDASGCKKPDHLSPHMSHSASKGPQNLPPTQNSPVLIGDQIDIDAPIHTNTSSGTHNFDSLARRQLDDAGIVNDEEIANDEEPANLPSDKSAHPKAPSTASKGTEIANGSSMDEKDCLRQGLASPPYERVETFTMGGMSDSTYEYLPKEWLLLGGLLDQYESMYRKAMDVVRDRLLFRPMTKSGRDVLFVGTLNTGAPSKENDQDKPSEMRMEYEGQHLTCFAGGMFALGSKIFGIKDDLEIARRLTDGCIWAYESTSTGIMPEIFNVVPCDNHNKCAWNETKWWEALDPYRNAREEQAKTWYENQKLLGQETPVDEAERPQRLSPTNMPVFSTEDERRDLEHSSRERRARDLEGLAEDLSRGSMSVKSHQDAEAVLLTPEEPAGAQSSSAEVAHTNSVPTKSQNPSPAFTPKAIATHEEFVQARIKEERLPPGFTTIKNKKYILRPEAIESVFIMYRATGDQYWRERGWKMFTAIQTYTLTEFGNSAITDVTSEVPVFSDAMESFWLAETLKYFYLLYSDPGIISLDDYVL